MAFSIIEPELSSLAVGQLLAEVISREDLHEILLPRLESLGLSVDDISRLATWHLDEFDRNVQYGLLAASEQVVGNYVLLFLNWLLSPLRTFTSSEEFGASVNFAIKTSWAEAFGGLSADVVRDQEVALTAWSLGKSIWTNGRPFPAVFAMNVLNQEINLAYHGLLEHLLPMEKAFNGTETESPEIARTAILWRLTALFEALANTEGPGRAIDQMIIKSRKVWPDRFRNDETIWKKKVIDVRNAFSHIVGSLRDNYDLPDSPWILDLIERGTVLTASTLSDYFVSEIPIGTAQRWADSAMDDML